MEQKIFTKFIVISDNELDILIDELGKAILEISSHNADKFKSYTKLYVKLMKEREELELERNCTE